MWHLNLALYVRMEEAQSGLQPLPWHLGFHADRAYRVLGCFQPPVMGVPQVLLRSEYGVAGVVAMYHLRPVACLRHATQDSLLLNALPTDEGLNLNDWVHCVMAR